MVRQVTRLGQFTNVFTVVTDGSSLLLLVSLFLEIQLICGLLMLLLYLNIVLEHFHFVVFLDDLERFLAPLELCLVISLLILCDRLQIIRHCLKTAKVLLL